MFSHARIRLGKLLPSPDLPFANDDANRLLPWIICFMIFLTGLMLAGALTLNGVVMDSQSDYVDSVSVEVPYQEQDMQGKLENMRDVLLATPGVTDVTILDDAAIYKMVEPWLGTSDALNALPMPRLLDVRIDPQAQLDRTALEQSIRKVVSEATIDDHQAWIGKFLEFTRMIQTVAFTLSAFIILTTAGIIILAARTSLKLHFRTVTMLHSLGAQDGYIMRQFQLNAFRLALKGAIIGTILGAVLFWLIGISASQFESPLFPSFSMDASHVVMFVLLPVLTGITALCATRLAVFSLLKKLP